MTAEILSILMFATTFAFLLTIRIDALKLIQLQDLFHLMK